MPVLLDDASRLEAMCFTMSSNDFSIKFGLLEVSVGKLNLIVGIHDNYINKIKNMVDFDNIEKVEVQEITPKLIE